MTHDVIIIGGGPAGLAAAIYAGRAKLDGFVLEKMSPGGQVLITDRVENYPGFPDGLTGFELVEKFSAHAQKFGMNIENGEVASIEPVGDLINITLTDQRTITTRSIVVATGATHRKLGVKGEDEFVGRGVSYCATCDGPFFKDQVVAVVGGGDSAVQEAIFLTRFAKKVYLIHRRDELRAIKVLADRAKENDKIEFVWDSVVEEIEGDDQVRSLKILNRKTGETTELKVDGVFIFIGIVPVTDFVKGLVETDEMGFIKTDQWMRTSIKGIYAAGDCRQKPLLQIVTAVAEGATAAYAVEHDLA